MLTGDATLDRLLQAFAARPMIAPMRKRRRAEGSCDAVALDLVDYLRARGFATPGREAFLSGDEWHEGELVRELLSPEDFGYDDRTVAGLNSHVVCLVELEEERWMVDFTAAQYGYKEFPLLQRLERYDDASSGKPVWSRLTAQPA